MEKISKVIAKRTKPIKRVVPSIRQKKAFKASLENGGIISKAMLEAGYSEATANTPQKLTSTLGWKELTAKFLSDDELAKKHSEQLNASKLTKLYFDADDSDDEIQEVCEKLGVELLFVKMNSNRDGKVANVKSADFFFRDLALDKAYKVKGRYADDGGGDKNTNILIVISGQTNSRYQIKSNAPMNNADSTDTSTGSDSERPASV